MNRNLPVGHTAKTLTALPTWLLVQAMRPLLPKSHPWKASFFTLEDWNNGETPFSKMADVVMWFYIALLAVFIAL